MKGITITIIFMEYISSCKVVASQGGLKATRVLVPKIHVLTLEAILKKKNQC
jgi:hypothetical protein